jgi:hypothetical protein
MRMDGTDTSGQRWARQSYRKGGGDGGVVRRTVMAPTAPWITEGNSRVGPGAMQQR